MRTINAGTISAMTSNREINARVTRRKIVPSFTQHYHTYDNQYMDQDEEVLVSYDSCDHGTGILRGMTIGSYVAYQYVPNLSSQPQYFTTNALRKTNSGLGLEGGRMFYQGNDNNFYYVDFSSGSPGTPVLISAANHGGDTSKPTVFAPVSTTEYYFMQRISSTEMGYAVSIHYHNLSNNDKSYWQGRMYNMYVMCVFDAVRFNNVDYIFFAEDEDRRSYYMEKQGDRWGVPKPVWQLDILDENSRFSVGSATVINGKMVVDGCLRRPGGIDFNIYMFGPPPFTMGRESIVGRWTQKPVGESGRFSPAWGGKMHFKTDTLWYVGLGVKWSAPATNIFGYDNASLKSTITNVESFSLSSQENGVGKLAISLPGGSVNVGDELELEIAYGGVYSSMGKFYIANIPKRFTQDGSIYQVNAYEDGVYRLLQWRSDSDYDFWSQTKQATEIRELTEMVREKGEWEESAFFGVWNHDINDPAFLYSVKHPARNALAYLRFNWKSSEDGIVKPKVGVALNFHHETKGEIVLPYWWNPHGWKPYGYGHYAFVACYGETEHSGGSGIALYRVRPSAPSEQWTKLTSWSWPSLTLGAQYEIGMRFHEGYFEVFWRATASSTWSLVGSYQYDQTNYPWPLPQGGVPSSAGRAAVYVENVTPYSNTYPYDSQALLIPVTNNSIIDTSSPPVACIQGSERFEVTGKSANRAAKYDDGTTFIPFWWTGQNYYDNAQHSNPYTGPWDGYGIPIAWSDFGASWNNKPTDHTYFDGCALVCTDGEGKGKVMKITDWDYISPKYWNPTVFPAYPDSWDKHVGDLSYGSWVESALNVRVFVEEDPKDSFGPGSTFRICPAYYVDERGEIAGTGNTGHEEWLGEFSMYSAVTPYLKLFNYYSEEVDITFEQAVTEVCRKAGVNVNPQKAYSGVRNFTTPGLNIVADYNYTGRPNKEGIFRIKFGSASEKIGIGSLNNDNDEATMVIVDHSADVVKLITWNGSSYTTVQQVPLDATEDGWWTFSAYDEYMSVWQADRLVWGFNVTLYDKICVCTDGTAGPTVDWPELDMRVDNFIMDVGKNAMTFIERLIGEKRIYFQENNGGITFLRDPELISATPYSLSFTGEETDTVEELFTRVRLEGAEVAEDMDDDAMHAYGNIFGLFESNELDTVGQFKREVLELIKQYIQTIYVDNFAGAADPRVQPSDRILVNIPSSDRSDQREIVVRQSSFEFTLAPEQATFDMEIQGEDWNG